MTNERIRAIAREAIALLEENAETSYYGKSEIHEIILDTVGISENEYQEVMKNA